MFYKNLKKICKNKYRKILYNHNRQKNYNKILLRYLKKQKILKKLEMNYEMI